MDELDNALAICVTGAASEKALEQFRVQLKLWDVAMPDVDGLVLDFGLGDFKKTGLIEYWVANEVEQGYCAKYLFVFDGQSCPMHSHKEKHETFFIVKGKVKMTYDGKSSEMKAGDRLPVEKGKVHGFTAIGPALLLEASKPCIVADNRFENADIPFGCNYKG